MNIQIIDENVVLTNTEHLNIPLCLDCGQAFRWKETENGIWQGIACGKFLSLKQEENKTTFFNTTKEDFENLWIKYFDLDRDYEKILSSYDEENLITACKAYPGIRILKQDEWEAICSFIISANNNIPRIKGIIERLCENFGEKIGENEYAFPTAEKLSGLTAEDLAPLRAGFRNRYLLDAAEKVHGKEVELEKCFTLPYEEAKAELMKITGVGEKVADCTLLFGFHRIEAFPVDVWMKRAMEVLFPDMKPEDFGEYAGIAQQYIFHYSRMHPDLFDKKG
jgi:N-glycosylase/DNA lyase